MTANHLPKIRGYEILNEVLPAGGLSNVYKARTKADNKVVAIKVLRKEFSKDPDRVKEFFNEAKVLKEVKHNNIAQILNIGSVNSQPYYFTMKYYRGGNLLKYIQNKKRLSLIEVLTISIQICEALDKIHREGYLHLDLKPSNILFDETNTLILTDFGSTKSILKDSNDETVIGTPQFMSPEQFDPEKQENFASDLYSLGILMYYMYAGSLPFNGKDAQQYQVMHTSTSPKSLKSYDKNINKDFNRIVTKLLEKEPVDRFVSSTKLKEELTNLKYKTQMHYKIKIEEIGQKGELVKSSTFKEYPIFLSKSKKAQNTFPIYDKEASKDHIRIEKNAEGNVYLRDTSTTGTVINGIRITNKSYFWQTDKAYLKIGNSKFILNKTKKNIGYKAYSFYSFLLVFIISIILYFGTNLFNERKLYISSFNIPQEVSVNENFNLNFKTTSDMTHDLSKVVIAPFGIKNKDKIVSYSANSFQSYSYDFTEVPAGENKYNFAIKLIDTEGNSSEWNKKKIIVNNYSDKLHIANLELPREVLVDSRVKYQFDLRSTLPKDKLFIEIKEKKNGEILEERNSLLYTNLSKKWRFEHVGEITFSLRAYNLDGIVSRNLTKTIEVKKPLPGPSIKITTTPKLINKNLQFAYTFEDTLYDSVDDFEVYLRLNDKQIKLNPENKYVNYKLNEYDRYNYYLKIYTPDKRTSRTSQKTISNIPKPKIFFTTRPKVRNDFNLFLAYSYSIPDMYDENELTIKLIIDENNKQKSLNLPLKSGKLIRKNLSSLAPSKYKIWLEIITGNGISNISKKQRINIK